MNSNINIYASMQAVQLLLSEVKNTNFYLVSCTPIISSSFSENSFIWTGQEGKAQMGAKQLERECGGRGAEYTALHFEDESKFQV